MDCIRSHATLVGHDPRRRLDAALTDTRRGGANGAERGKLRAAVRGADRTSARAATAGRRLGMIDTTPQGRPPLVEITSRSPTGTNDIRCGMDALENGPGGWLDRQTRWINDADRADPPSR
jgi:hypothetical protein